MSTRTPHRRGQPELAGAIQDLTAELRGTKLVANIEQEGAGDSPPPITYHEWLASQAPRRAGAP